MSTHLSDPVRRAAKKVGDNWNACDPVANIPADASVQIAAAACAVQLAEITRALREGESLFQGELIIQHNTAADFLDGLFGDPEVEASHEAGL